jgi:aminoglycoside N3'-acetyltransferase
MNSNSFHNRVISELNRIKLPNQQIIMLHVHLHPLQKATGMNYSDCTKFILDVFNEFSPKALLVPAFTHTFVKTGLYHCDCSRSETGRFSEEVRCNHARCRTSDPMFSVLDMTDWLETQKNLNFSGAFEPGCIWELLLEKDCVIVNIGIKSMVATQIHYFERINSVPWRMHVHIPGVVYHDANHYEQVDYDFFARDLKQNRLLDWPKIKNYLKSVKCIHETENLDVKVAWLSTRKFHESLLKKVLDDPYFLVRKI